MALRQSESSFQPNHQWTTAQLELTVLAVQPVLTPLINPPQSQPAEPSDLRPLASVLARLYPDNGNQERILFYIELEQSTLDFDKPAAEIWVQMIAMANAAGVLKHLLDVAMSEYPNNRALIGAVQQLTIPTLVQAISPQRLALRHLIAAFAMLYDDEASLRRIIADAGIDAAYINISGSSLVAWYRVFQWANRIGQISNLLQIATADYASNQALSDAMAAWQAAMVGQDGTTADASVAQQADLVETATLAQTEAALRQLGRVLASLYPDVGHQRMIAYDAGLSQSFLNFAGPAITVWSRILDEAEKQGHVDNLLAVVTEEYGRNPELAEAHARWRAATTDPAEETMSKVGTKAAA